MAARYGFAPQEQDSPAALSDPWVFRAPQSQAAEAYRSLRTTLLMSRAGKPPQVVLVMSGSPGEGKSTTCLNTAAAFAIRGDQGIFLDADLRKPHAHCLFRCANDVGLSNCLTSETDFREALQRHPNIESLKLLPAGPNAPNPAELLGRSVSLRCSKSSEDTLTSSLLIVRPFCLYRTDCHLRRSRTGMFWFCDPRVLQNACCADVWHGCEHQIRCHLGSC